MSSQSVISTLCGHTHRVCWASIHPLHEQQFVTCSLDCSLKVWDMEAVRTGQVPPAGGLHYIILTGSPDCRLYASCQGWMTNCSIFRVDSSTKVYDGASHGGFIASAAFSLDSSLFVSIDHGHSGEYSVSANYPSNLAVVWQSA